MNQSIIEIVEKHLGRPPRVMIHDDDHNGKFIVSIRNAFPDCVEISEKIIEQRQLEKFITEIIDLVRMCKSSLTYYLSVFDAFRPKIVFIRTYDEMDLPESSLSALLRSSGYSHIEYTDHGDLWISERPVPSDQPLLSILIPSIPSRSKKFNVIFSKIEGQSFNRSVEIISLVDNKRRSIGLKRDVLVQAARGKFVAFVDDDDDVSDDYVDLILRVIKRQGPIADVITFKQKVTINDSMPFVVEFGLGNENQQVQIDENGNYGDVKRKPFHVCAWRSALAKNARFPDASYGEDHAWCEQLWAQAESEVKIDKIIHMYKYNDATTEARKEQII